MPMSPQVYADMLFDKIKKHNANCWLVNTGWTGGRYGFGKVNFSLKFQRISLENTRNIIHAIHDNKIKEPMDTLPIFNLKYPTKIEGVDQHILNPADSWKNKN